MASRGMVRSTASALWPLAKRRIRCIVPPPEGFDCQLTKADRGRRLWFMSGRFWCAGSRSDRGRELLDNFRDESLGVAEEHEGLVHVIEVVIDTGKTRAH